MAAIGYALFDTALGDCGIAWSERGIVGVQFPEASPDATRARLERRFSEARELEQGHLHHAEVHTNPTDGEVEDTDVGFPGKEHYIAERALPMKAAMGILAVLATIAGALQIPTVTDALHHFLHPTFEGSKYYSSLNPSNEFTFVFMAGGAAVGLLGIFIAWQIWSKQPGSAAAMRARFKPLYELSFHKWWFDELIDYTIVKPAAWTGRFAQNTF